MAFGSSSGTVARGASKRVVNIESKGSGATTVTVLAVHVFFAGALTVRIARLGLASDVAPGMGLIVRGVRI